jgi:hypothetical protein
MSSIILFLFILVLFILSCSSITELNANKLQAQSVVWLHVNNLGIYSEVIRSQQYHLIMGMICNGYGGNAVEI